MQTLMSPCLHADLRASTCLHDRSTALAGLEREDSFDSRVGGHGYFNGQGVSNSPTNSNSTANTKSSAFEQGFSSSSTPSATTRSSSSSGGGGGAHADKDAFSSTSFGQEVFSWSQTITATLQHTLVWPFMSVSAPRESDKEPPPPHRPPPVITVTPAHVASVMTALLSGLAQSPLPDRSAVETIYTLFAAAEILGGYATQMQRHVWPAGRGWDGRVGGCIYMMYMYK